jgi:hypothetical protein
VILCTWYVRGTREDGETIRVDGDAMMMRCDRYVLLQVDIGAACACVYCPGLSLYLLPCLLLSLQCSAVSSDTLLTLFSPDTAL